MSDYDVLRQMLERSPIPGKESTGSGSSVKGEWVEDPTVDFDGKTLEPHGEGKQIVVWRGYPYFYIVIGFDQAGNLVDMEAYE